jgi:catechol 2,3-dioxygenase-like lactoylglutathione lyase family enzyme
VAGIVSRISVVYLYVKDMDRARAFYRDLLGIPLSDDPHWAEAKLDGLRFALHEWHEGVGDPASGTVNVDFEVSDIDAAAQRLRDAGVAVGEISRQEFGAFCEFTDPEGYTLELFQPPA